MTVRAHLKMLTSTLVLAVLAVSAGCAFTPPQGRPTADPLVLAHRCDRPDHGFDYQSLWKNLDIRSELFSDTENELPVAADVITLESVDADVRKTIVLRDGWNCQWQYLLFRNDKECWQFIGHVDVPDQPYVAPWYRLERDGEGQTSLVISRVACWGTGVYDRKEAWYRLSSHGIRLEKEIAVEDHRDE